MKICVGVAANDSFKTQTVGTLIALFKSKPDMRFILKQSPYVHDNREQIVVDFLKTDCSHLFFVDTDMIFQPSVLDDLLAHDKDIIGAQYYKRGTDKEPVAPSRYDMPGMAYPHHIFKNYAAGTGCLLIKREVFEKMPRPWFGLGTPDQWLGEDVFFCKRAKESGFEVWIDPMLEVGHIGDRIY